LLISTAACFSLARPGLTFTSGKFSHSSRLNKNQYYLLSLTHIVCLL